MTKQMEIPTANRTTKLTSAPIMISFGSQWLETSLVDEMLDCADGGRGS